MTGFGQRLRTAREAAGLSQDAVALEMSISKGAVSLWENSKTFPQLETFMGLCRLYRQSADSLLFGESPVTMRVADDRPVYGSQDMKPADLSMAIQLANEKIASAGLAPTPEQYGQFVLQLYDVLEGGLPNADVLDLRSGKLLDTSTGESHDTPASEATGQGQRTAKPAVQHAGKARRKP